MFYKPYATLNVECQSSYSTKDIAQSGQNLGDVSDGYLAVFICSIVVFILQFIFVFINCSLNKWVVGIVTLLEFGGHAALIILYSKLQNKVNKIDIYMYQYLRDNKCTDGALSRGIDMFTKDYANDIKVTSVGLFFVLASCAATFLIFVCTNKALRECLSGCCQCFSGLKDTPSYENRANDLQKKFTKRFTRRREDPEP
jgi:hypothetical protein